MTRTLVAGCLVALAACHHRSHLDAPGVIQLEVPPVEPTREAMEQPGLAADPGEHVVSLHSGILAALGGNSIGAVGDFAIETTLNWGENEVSDDTPESAFRLADRGYGVTLGWSAVRLIDASDGDETRVETGPIYIEAQRFWMTDVVGYAGLGAGWAVRPDTGDHGPQVNGWIIGPLFTRARYFIDGGFELSFGVQLKYPATWAWSR